MTISEKKVTNRKNDAGKMNPFSNHLLCITQKEGGRGGGTEEGGKEELKGEGRRN